MGAKIEPHIDIIERVTFDLNILVCGNYVEANILNELKEVKTFTQHDGKPYFKKGIHKFVKSWKYYLFSQDKDIGENTFKFIEDLITINKTKPELLDPFLGKQVKHSFLVVVVYGVLLVV